MKKNTIRLTKRDLNKLISETVQRVLQEERWMSDEDIAQQYSDMKITYFEMKPLEHSKGWEGVFELEFPNADGEDYSESMVNDFIVYDKEGKRIAWDHWMPNNETRQLQAIIRQEIRKRLNKQ